MSTESYLLTSWRLYRLKCGWFMGGRRRNQEDAAIDVAKGIAGLVLLVGLLATFQPQLFAMLVRAAITLLILGLLVVLGLIIFRHSQARRRNDTGAFGGTYENRPSAPVWRPRIAPVVTVSPPNNFSSPGVVPETPKSPSPAPTTADLDKIDWFQFEKVMELLYESRGNRVERRGGANPDGGIDLVLHKGDKRAAIQCKHWKTWKVGVCQIRDFFGGMKSEGFDRGIFVAWSGCTIEAREFADRNHVTILGSSDVGAMLSQAGAQTQDEIRGIINDPTKHCPKCGASMEIRVVSHGSNRGSRFWGCSTHARTRCNGKIQITLFWEATWLLSIIAFCREDWRRYRLQVGG
jgi:hypothetical protein